MNINIVICCKMFLFAEALRNLIDDVEAFNVIGIVTNKEDVNYILQYKADIIIADQEMYKNYLKNSFNHKDAKILLFSNGTKNLIYSDLKEMVSRGLYGIISTDTDFKILEKAIFKVFSGEMWIDHKTIKNSLMQYDNNDGKEIVLTKKEKEVLNYLCSGYTNKGIANKLCVSEQTVKSHCNRLFKKFGVPNRVKLVLCASKIEIQNFMEA